MDFETLPPNSGAGGAITSPCLKSGFTPPEPTRFSDLPVTEPQTAGNTGATPPANRSTSKAKKSAKQPTKAKA